MMGTIPIFIIDDSMVEYNETFTLGISSNDSRVIIVEDKNESMVIIEDNDGMELSCIVLVHRPTYSVSKYKL
jgi:hypothetical protein